MRENFIVEAAADVHPGQPIRFPVEEKGRFEPLDPDLWKESYLVAPTGFNALDIHEVH